MQKIFRSVLLLLLLNSLIHFAKGQGCSDAGFCTLNSFKPNSSDSTSITNNQLKIGVSYGNADHAISVIGNYLEYNRQLNEKLGIDVKIASLAQNGNGISTFGLSDIYLNANYRLSQALRLTIGTKIPLNNGNKKKNNLSLPLDYQSSLGTVDLILGVGYEIKKIQFVAALQQPLTQNKNGHLSENHSPDSKLRSFQSTNNFKRSGDVLLRISYPVSLGRKIKITPGLLPIYHLANDRFTDSSGVEKEIKGSQGLTLNGNAYVDYELNDHNILQLSMGTPFIFRESRPDGLTRSFVVTLEYRIKF